MQITDGKVEYQTSDGVTIESSLFTYNEEERQDNEVNRVNAGLIFSPKFIPIYPELLDKLTLTEAMIYGFIDFYKSNNSSRFYFTNEQLANIIRCSSDTISRSISRLEMLGFISTSRKVKAGGGQIRFINDILYNPDSTISTSLTTENLQVGLVENLQTNNNKINNNNINNILPPKKEEVDDFQEFKQRWNNVPKFGIANKGLPKVIKDNDELVKIYKAKRKVYTFDEIIQAVQNYIDNMIQIPKENSFHKHRFTMIEFLGQKNGLAKYINFNS